MADIRLSAPLEMEFDTIESETSHLQTIRFAFVVKGTEYSHSFEYRGSFWMEAAVFDRFLEDLKSQSAANAVFNDIDNEFIIAVGKTGNTFTWQARRKAVGDGVRRGALMKASFESVLLPGQTQDIVEAFQAYPRWW